ncbi:MAG: hypothetical protein Q9195_000728 [Heterodermia aff. obscurata]
MPTLYCKLVTTQVSVADLVKSTTTISSAGEVERINKVFSNSMDGGTLWETPIVYQNDCSRMQFLGDGQSIPFLTVHAGKDFFNIHTQHQHNKRPLRLPEDFEPIQPEPDEVKKPHAIAITVFLSPQSFEPYTSLKSKDSAREDNRLRDIKIDVYYNGAFLSSRTVTKGFAESKHIHKEQIVRISGLPSGKHSERALSFVPPGQTPDGNLQMNTRNKETSLNRWRKISRMLDLEALRLPPSCAPIADGLKGLSKIEIPGDMIRMHKAGRTYSLIDVIVTSGDLQESIMSPLFETQEATRGARNVAVVTPETSARRNATLEEAPVEPSRAFSGAPLSSPSYNRRNQTSNRRPAFGYVFTFEPPQPTVEQEFRAIQEAAESPTKISAGRRKATKRARLTRSQTPALATNHNAALKGKGENHGRLNARSASPKKLDPVPELATPTTKDSASIKNTASSAPSTPIVLEPTPKPLKRKRANPSDIAAHRNEMFREEGCALTLSNRYRDAEPQRASNENFKADTVIGITRFVFY